MSSQADSITVSLVDGTKVVVPDSLECITSYVLQEQGDWFEDEIKFLRKLVKPGDTVVDIGANYGVYALSLARRVGLTGKVWAFEPATDTAGFLGESAVANGTDWLVVVQQALSDNEGTAWLQTPGHSELNSLADSCLKGVADAVGPGEAVAVTTLDACFKKFGWSTVDLLKIDAEGEEERILRGGYQFLQSLSPLVMFEVKAGLELHLDLVDRFSELGYLCFQLVPGLDALSPFDAGLGVDGYLLNLFAAKPDRCQALADAGLLIRHTDLTIYPITVLDLDSWMPDLETHPYAKCLARLWHASAQRPEQAVIHQALAAWSISRDCTEPVAKRYAALSLCFEILLQLCHSECRVSRWASLTRVALALGQRQQAMHAVSAMLTDIQSCKPFALDEPFLCPDPAFDAVNPADEPEAWLEAAGLAAIERFGSFSSFYTGVLSLPRLERLIMLGFADESIHRRISLLKERFSRPD